MPDNTPQRGLVSAFFSRLLFGGKRQEEEAARARQAAMSAVADLEALTVAPGLPDDIRAAASPLARLLYLWIHAGPEHLANASGALHAAAALAGRVARLAEQGTAVPPAVPAEFRALALRLQDLPAQAAGPLQAEEKKVPPLPQRLAALEIRDICKELDRQSPQLPPDMRSLLERILAATRDILRRNDGPAGERRFVRKYLGAAQQVVAGVIALDKEKHALGEQREVMRRSVDILSRIAGAFEAQAHTAAERRKDDFSADLAVIDTLLRIDGR